MNIDRIKEIRESNDIKQEYIAKLLNVSQQQYSKYELGINPIPLEKIYILSNYYDTSIDYLINKTDIRKPYPKSLYEKDKKHINYIK